MKHLLLTNNRSRGVGGVWAKHSSRCYECKYRGRQTALG